MKKFLLDKVGARGLLQMIQAFIYASICVFFHTVMFPELIGILPIAILIGIIALQPTYGITKKVIPKIGLAFALACLVVIISTLLLPINIYTYYFVMIVVILAVNFIMPQKYMVMTLAIATAIYFLGVSGDEPMPLYLLAIIALFDVFLFFIIVRLVVRFVHLPLEKTIQTIMNQLTGLFNQEIESVFTKNEKFITKPLYSIFVQSQMFIKEYSAGKKANPRHVELYKDLLPCYLALFFHMQTMEDIGRAGLSEEAKQALSRLNIKVSNQINQKEVDPVASFHVKKFVESFLIIKAGMAELAQGGNGK
ncbi:hypothetical protein HCJ21_03410 [Listeria seeligeri]|uniref:hypothetical protein n=1 Tax=Listeria seeligeri TaxID=1640 RepID=UPI000953349A|nr:hypothetical protein [Listeria seeligeri]MBC1576772.1 hypothetical protein [Listeria seeligeri]MBC1580762.1 hypothetical protein [Listeria seeligeri]MBC1584669.1 hypothetical protein [Listeria seeligeri]MBC1595625.1 hypothetical protein [Listeria seeligeri]MBC1598304.1 hypothetical protein [Listeria seeligeri]